MKDTVNFFKTNYMGILLCLCIALPSWAFGKTFPIIGGPIVAILLGMIVSTFIKDRSKFDKGIKFTSKKILQYAVILLGFGMNLQVIFQTGRESLPIILATISTSLIVAYLLCKLLKIPSKISVLIGVGSSICGGSAIAATAPVIEANDDEVAQAISVIFLFNVIAAILFPILGSMIGFSTTSGDGFGIFAGTAINDTSSVTAAASTWDSMYGLGSATLDKAVTVKLTRTLAIIPITLALALIKSGGKDRKSVPIKDIFPFFILYFVGASVITTIGLAIGVPNEMFMPLKDLSKFFIIMAMGAIGLNTNIVKLIKNGGKPILLGLSCWISITLVSLTMQHIMGIW